MYNCQICQKAPATVHLTDIHNNVKKTLHMCEACAQKKGFVLHQSISLTDASHVSDLGKAESGAPRKNELTCASCGLTWTQFRQQGRFGCAECYKSLRPRIDSILEDIQARRIRHEGKHPSGDGAQRKRLREILETRRLLRQAIENEAYEEAASLRDNLRSLESESSN